MSSGVLVAVGSYDPPKKKSEKFQEGVWTDIQEVPVVNRLSNYAVIFDAGNFYYFGGYDGSGISSSILRLNAASWTWSFVGTLNSPRVNHGVILVENTIMVIGGTDYTLYYKLNSRLPIEVCLLNNGQLNCEEKTSSLTDNFHTPLLFVVSNSFGLC